MIPDLRRFLVYTSAVVFGGHPLPRRRRFGIQADDEAIMQCGEGAAVVSLPRVRHLPRLGYSAKATVAYAAAALHAELSADSLVVNGDMAVVELERGEGRLQFILRMQPDLKFWAQAHGLGDSEIRYATAQQLTLHGVNSVKKLFNEDLKFHRERRNILQGRS